MSEEKRVFQSRAPPNHFDISFLVIYFLIGVRCSKQNPPWGLLQAVEGAEGHRPERGRLFNLQSPLSSGSEPGQDLGSVASPPHPASPYIQTPSALIWCLNTVPGPQSALINGQMDD